MKSSQFPKSKRPKKREVVRRINSMHVVIENEWGDLSVGSDQSHDCYNHMWEWDRLDRRAWYLKHGDAWDKFANK